MAQIPHVNDTWYIQARNLIAGVTPVVGTTPGASVSFVASLPDGTTYTSGVLVWNGFGFTNQWTAAITLPSFPTQLSATITAVAVISGVSLRGTLEQSLNVVS
jgi:hypothetical protein